MFGPGRSPPLSFRVLRQDWTNRPKAELSHYICKRLRREKDRLDLEVESSKKLARLGYPAARIFQGKVYFLMRPSSNPALPWTGRRVPFRRMW